MSAEDQRPILFRVHSASPLLASTRYRALMPALGLEARGYRCIVSDRALDEATLRGCRCIVFTKAFRPVDFELAQAAHAAGALIVLDVCDDMFIPNYDGGKGAHYASTFQAMARLASAIVTTGDALREVVQPLAGDTPVSIIPDQVETPELVSALLSQPPPRVTWRARAAFALRNPSAAVKRVRERISKPSAPPSAPASAESSYHQTIIWFGNHGAAHSRFGMAMLEKVLPHLAKAARSRTIKLVVVSNSREKFDALFAGADFPAEYREWAPTRIFADLDEADICLIPMPTERFARGKSANRVALALSRGAAVIADSYPALADFAGCVITDDWGAGLKLYLEDEARRQADIARGQAVIARLFSADVIAQRWADLIEATTTERSR